MPSQSVRFSYRPGLASHRFDNVRLMGSWDAAGRPAAAWSSTPMAPAADPDASPCFDAAVDFDAAGIGTTFRWGVQLDGPAGDGVWGIAAEVDDAASADRVRQFVLSAATPAQIYYLTQCRRLGAVKLAAGGAAPGLRVSLWAPNAQAVDLVMADPAHGYIANDGTGAVRSVPMAAAEPGIWRAGPERPELADFGALLGMPYMFRITKDDGTIAYRTDMYSLMQIGAGDFDPQGQPYTGAAGALQGPQSCSVVCDPDIVQLDTGTQSAAAFWRDEFDPRRQLPSVPQDLVIYELHVGALGFGKATPGTFDDAIALLDHLSELGVNAVELLPIAEFENIANWGYGTAQFMAIDRAAGGTDRMKQFVKACHQRGIAVILDVCYNHFDPNADRAEWMYDSNDPARNIYFWYEGQPGDYADPSGGYLDNDSTGFAPRYSEEMVRQLFISSAAFFVEVCHVDGFRLDQTSSIHEYNERHADGQTAGTANAFGVKFLRQWTRTMRLLRPGLFLTAEDYSNWSEMTAPSLAGDGVGFDTTWYGDFQHHLVQSPGFAELVTQAGFGDDRSLRMDFLAGALGATGGGKVVYAESHDDCGNRPGSARTIVLAVDGASLLVDATRRWAEARVRFAAGISLLSAGTPMFFMGEEIGAQKPYRYDNFLLNREDIVGDARGVGANLFAYFKALIRLSIETPAIRSRNIEVGYTDNANRVIAFHRWDGAGEYLVLGCLANAAFTEGYWVRTDRLGGFGWTEIFNSDGAAYGGWNVGNAGRTLVAENGSLNVVLPAAGLVVLRKG
jgi:1,4-alpha-glucan branching enzyme